ncbi:MAG: ATP-binding protein [Algoriphagus sp.]|uniref:Dph6-related ATP pyrophosphatase n=1 Tax=Algoriphagus sp. TaxID=1872435 RepID=UPI0027307C29|nr:ATP-binding protein [Algoriphagus sp.]MDP2042836.1 ATP-binding protein [Algoriphagus sp.]MDP3473405.1 ATP-binding protein [Algoriphagus sp.]
MKNQTTPSKIKVSFSWSGGKDSAFALWKLQNDSMFEVRRLHTTFGEETRRVGLHGIHEDLIVAQADSLGLPLDKIFYPASGDNQAYEKAMNKYLDVLESEGIRHIAFGDIFLEDLRKYREEKLAERGFHAIFPLWKIDTTVLANDFIKAGFKTLICAADADLISKEKVGMDFSKEFLESLPKGADPCGENGEFHSFCYSGPIFENALELEVEEILSKSYDIPLATGAVDKKHYWFAAIHSLGSKSH